MSADARKFFHLTPPVRAAILMFTSTVGAGVLCIPYVISRAGLMVGVLLMVGIGLTMLLINLLVGEMIARTRQHLQLTGLIRRYLGKRWAIIMLLAFLGMHLSAVVAYLIGEGESLAALFGGSTFYWAMLFFVVGGIWVIGGRRRIALFDSLFIVITISALLILGIVGLAHAETLPIKPLLCFNPWLAVGVFLSSFHGLSALAEMEIVVQSHPHKLRRAIFWGTGLPLVLYLIFAVGIVVVTGRGTTEVATVGLGQKLGDGIFIIGNVLAISAMASCFVNVCQALRRTFEWDLGWGKKRALVLALGVPLAIYLLGARAFVSVIGAAGLIFGTTEIFLLIWAYKHSRREGDVAVRDRFTPI